MPSRVSVLFRLAIVAAPLTVREPGEFMATAAVVGFDRQLTPAAHGNVTVKSCPVTPVAVMLTLYVPGAAQKPQFPKESAMMIEPGICWVNAESV